MLRDFLKVEKEDRLVEQQDASSGKVNSTDVTEWIIVNKNGDKRPGGVIQSIYHPPFLLRELPHHPV